MDSKKLLFLSDFLKERYFSHFHVNKNDLVPSEKFRILDEDYFRNKFCKRLRGNEN